MEIKYIPRSIEDAIKNALKEFPVLVLTGPRQTGKTTLLKQLLPDYQYVTLDDLVIRRLANDDPSLFLDSYANPVFIDEIQYAPLLLPYIKIKVDENRNRMGQFVLTGSQMFPLISGISESLAGRAVNFELLGLSLIELPEKKNNSIIDLFKRIYMGSYPAPLVQGVSFHNFYRSYLQLYIERDIRQIESVHDLNVFQRFLELLGSRVGNLLVLSGIARDCSISHTTARRWLSLLEATRIVYLLKPFYKNISKRIVKSPKIYFTDTGLLAYLLRYQNAETLQKSFVAGALFENFILMEILKYKFNCNKFMELYFYRDSNQNEIDLILDIGHMAVLCEIKMNKTIKTDHYKSMMKLGPIFSEPKKYLISLFDKNISLAPGIINYPWWQLGKLLNSGLLV